MIVDANAKSFLEDTDILYPVTIVEDRYNGTYSGWQWIAFNMEAIDIPQDVSGSDLAHAEFWSKNNVVVGKGNTPTEALEELRTNILDS